MSILGGIWSVAKNTVASNISNESTLLATPLDSFWDCRNHTLDFPPGRKYLWKIDLPTLNPASFNLSYDDSSDLKSNIIGNITSNVTAAATWGVGKLKSALGVEQDGSSFPLDFVPRVLEATISLPGFETVETVYQGWKYVYPSTETQSDLSVSVWADENGFALGYYMLWHNRIKNRDGTVNYPQQYERDIPIGLYRPDHSLACQLTAYGAFPTDISSIQLTSGGPDAIFKSYKITFKVREVGINKMNQHPLRASYLNNQLNIY